MNECIKELLSIYNFSTVIKTKHNALQFRYIRNRFVSFSNLKFTSIFDKSSESRIFGDTYKLVSLEISNELTGEVICTLNFTEPPVNKGSIYWDEFKDISSKTKERKFVEFSELLKLSK